MVDRGVGPTPQAGTVHQLAPGLVRITAPNPGLMTGPGTNTYVVGEGDLAVVDPGPESREHGERIVATAAPLGQIRWILLTHTHADHWPGTTWLASETGAITVGYEARDGFTPAQVATDGWQLPQPGPRLVAVHTPGHAGNHLCWVDQDLRLVITGDHVMHGSTVVIRPPDGEMSTYLASLARLRRLDPRPQLIAPGHGRLMTDLDHTVDDLVSHRLARERIVAAVLSELQSATIDQMLTQVYADVTKEQLTVARYSLWAHLRKLVEDDRAAVDTDVTDDQIDGVWTATETTAA